MPNPHYPTLEKPEALPLKRLPQYLQPAFQQFPVSILQSRSAPNFERLTYIRNMFAYGAKADNVWTLLDSLPHSAVEIIYRPFGRIVDLGSCTGATLRSFADKFLAKHWAVCGFDLNPEFARFFQKKTPHSDITLGNMDQISAFYNYQNDGKNIFYGFIAGDFFQINNYFRPDSISIITMFSSFHELYSYNPNFPLNRYYLDRKRAKWDLIQNLQKVRNIIVPDGLLLIRDPASADAQDEKIYLNFCNNHTEIEIFLNFLNDFSKHISPREVATICSSIETSQKNEYCLPAWLVMEFFRHRAIPEKDRSKECLERYGVASMAELRDIWISAGFQIIAVKAYYGENFSTARIPGNIKVCRENNVPVATLAELGPQHYVAVLKKAGI